MTNANEEETEFYAETEDGKKLPIKIKQKNKNNSKDKNPVEARLEWSGKAKAWIKARNLRELLRPKYFLPFFLIVASILTLLICWGNQNCLYNSAEFIIIVFLLGCLAILVLCLTKGKV